MKTAANNYSRKTSKDAIDSRVKHAKHCDKIQNKLWALQGKQALLDMWERDPDKAGHEYILALRSKIRSLRCNLQAMRPGEDEELP